MIINNLNRFEDFDIALRVFIEIGNAFESIGTKESTETKRNVAL